MDHKEFIISQLARTSGKKYESYVINRIINKIDDFSVKFVTQQYISRPNGYALTDLYFPQINLHVEVDEKHHKKNIKSDKIREIDIINATNHKIVRVDVTKNFYEINIKIDEIVKLIKEKIKKQKSLNKFIPFEFEKNFNPQTHIEKGYIDISDDVAFKTIKDGCNCFGHNYENYQRATAKHLYNENIIIWFPKLYENENWINDISKDENIITEKSKDKKINKERLKAYLSKNSTKKTKRIIFARVKGNLGEILYRFKGLYQLNKEESKEQNKLIWYRIGSKVKTYKNKESSL